MLLDLLVVGDDFDGLHPDAADFRLHGIAAVLQLLVVRRRLRRCLVMFERRLHEHLHRQSGTGGVSDGGVASTSENLDWVIEITVNWKDPDFVRDATRQYDDPPLWLVNTLKR